MADLAATEANGSQSRTESTDDGVDPSDLEARLVAVERALTDGETPVADLDDAETLQSRLKAVETTVERLDDRVADLEAASRALRGYAGGIQAVNEDIERRADLALAKAEAVERSLRDDPGLTVETLDPEVERLDTERTTERDRPDGRTADETDPEPASGTDTANSQAATTSTDDEAGSAERSLATRIRDVL